MKITVGCFWESNEVFTSRKKAEAVMKKWEKESVCKSTGMKVEEVK